MGNRIMLVGSACNNYLQVCEKNKNLSQYTLKAYRIDLMQFVAFLDEGAKLQFVTKEDIRKFQQFLTNRGCLPSSIKRKLACIKAMFRWYELEEVLVNNIFHKFHLNVRVAKVLPKNIPIYEIRKLIENSRKLIELDEKRRYAPNEIVSRITIKRDVNKLTTLLSLEIMLCTGVRVGELIDITLDDIDIADRRIKIFGKGMRERFVFLPDQEICSLIEAYLIARAITEPNHFNLLV